MEWLLHQSAYSLVTPHRFVRLLFGKTSQNWCSPGVVPQMPSEICSNFHHICVLILHFTAQSASSWGCHRRAVISLYFLILLYTARVGFFHSICISTQAFIRTVSFGVCRLRMLRWENRIRQKDKVSAGKIRTRQ